MSDICQELGISRQAHYQMGQRQQQQRDQAGQIVELVLLIRHRHPRMGGRKLFHQCQPQWEKQGISLGRDRFFDLLAQHDLLVPLKRQKRRTTWPGGWRCPNRLVGLALTHVGQVWVCDLTYLETEAGFCYLALVTDAYSRYIVGFDVSTSLAVEGALRACNRAINQATTPLSGLIHHSDHGIQYTCHLYRQRLAELDILSSLGEVGNCYENALAERVNGILKLEYGLSECLLDFQQAQHLTQQAVWLYNHERPHLALDYQKPVDVHTPIYYVNSSP
jgi:transposase InsO family protein